MLEVEVNLRQGMSPRTPWHGAFGGLPARDKYMKSRFNVLRLEGYLSQVVPVCGVCSVCSSDQGYSGIKHKGKQNSFSLITICVML